MTFTKESNRIYCAQDGKTLAEVTFPETAPGMVVIDHTWVDPSLRGQGTAGQLMQAVVDLLRADGRKAQATCSYARAWLAAGHLFLRAGLAGAAPRSRRRAGP